MDNSTPALRLICTPAPVQKCPIFPDFERKQLILSLVAFRRRARSPHALPRRMRRSLNI